MAAAKSERWAVVCDDYRKEYRTEAAALTGRELVEEAGHCRLPHRLERVR